MANDISAFKSNNIINSIKDDLDRKTILNSENFQFNNVDCKINLNIGDNKDNLFNVTTNKDVLGKLINDLNKASEMIKKFHEA